MTPIPFSECPRKRSNCVKAGPSSLRVHLALVAPRRSVGPSSSVQQIETASCNQRGRRSLPLIRRAQLTESSTWCIVPTDCWSHCIVLLSPTFSARTMARQRDFRLDPRVYRDDVDHSPPVVEVRLDRQDSSWERSSEFWKGKPHGSTTSNCLFVLHPPSQQQSSIADLAWFRRTLGVT